MADFGGEFAGVFRGEEQLVVVLIVVVCGEGGKRAAMDGWDKSVR